MSYLLQRTLNTATARATNYHLIHYLAGNIIHHMLETSCLHQLTPGGVKYTHCHLDLPRSLMHAQILHILDV